MMDFGTRNGGRLPAPREIDRDRIMSMRQVCGADTEKTQFHIVRHANNGSGVMTSSGKWLWCPFFIDKVTAAKLYFCTNAMISGAAS